MTTPNVNAARERHWTCAQRVRKHRLALGLAQREVISRLHSRGTATSSRALSTIENGGTVELGLLPDLADALGCTVTHLLGLTDGPQAWQP
jgi:transcriptional regulator with XRE-family HTH domain